MPITAYSKTYQRELDVSQLESLFDQSSLSAELSFRDFVITDIECPACNVTGGHVVNEGVSSSTGRKVSQKHFSFRSKLGRDTHLSFCDFYNGTDKLKVVANEGSVDFRKSNSPVTKAIGLMSCIAIENGFFTQRNIRDMRQWFLELRNTGDFSFDINSHVINLARVSYIRTKRNSKSFVPDPIGAHDEKFNIDKEVYESLYHKLPQYNLASCHRENSSYFDIRLQAVVKKAITIVKKDSKTVSFDREMLFDKYKLATRLSMAIIQNNDVLYNKLSASRGRVCNPLMAISSLLLFTSDWNYELALEKVKKISNIKTAKDLNAGNIIGLNPFVNYSAWIIIKKLNSIRNELNDNTDYDAEFNAEKARLIKLYNLS